MIKTLNILLKQDKERFVVPKGVQDVIPVKAIDFLKLIVFSTLMR